MPDRYFLLGANVERSPTPRMIQAAFRALGLDAVFTAHSVGPGEFSSALQRMNESGVRGMNVTMPYKRAVIGQLDSLDDIALRTGAVNTIKKIRDKLRGYNTDVQGIVWPLSSRLRQISDAAVLGTGGAARAFTGAMSELGCQALTAFSRHPETASEFLSDMKESFPSIELEVVPFDASESLEPQVLFNATPCGSSGIPLPVQVERILESRPVVFDAVYFPVETELIKMAKTRGCPVIFGHEMLLQQAIEAIKVWTGSPPPASVMREALMTSLEVPA